LSRRILVLDFLQHLPETHIRLVLNKAKSGLLARIQERIDATQESFLILLKVGICRIELANGTPEFLFGSAVVDGPPQLSQSALSSLADLKALLNELLDERQDLSEHVLADFDLLLELIDVKNEYRVLNSGSRFRQNAGTVSSSPQFLTLLLLPRQSVSSRSSD